MSIDDTPPDDEFDPAAEPPPEDEFEDTEFDIDDTDEPQPVDLDAAGTPQPDVPMEMPQQVIDGAVNRRLRKEADRIVDELYQARMTPELVQQMYDATVRALDAQLLLDVREAQATAAAAEAAVRDPAKPFYRNRFEFFEQFLSEVYRRDVVNGGQKKWCLMWWKHSEAVLVVDALWRSWEKLRVDPGTGMSVWKKDHADHHMNVLFDPNGTFQDCSVKNGHRPLPPIPSDPIPAELLAEEVDDSPVTDA